MILFSKDIILVLVIMEQDKKGRTMNYYHYPLDPHEQGKTVEFTIEDNSCKVMILDDLNLARYKSGNKYEFIGTKVNHSSERIIIPDNRRWHAIIDFGVDKKTSRVSVKVI